MHTDPLIQAHNPSCLLAKEQLSGVAGPTTKGHELKCTALLSNIGETKANLVFDISYS